MCKLLAGLLAATLSALAIGATTTPVQLLNPSGSTAGQAIVSTGPSTAPGWATVTAGGITPIAANSVYANFTGSSASPIANAVPSCNTSTSALQYTSGTGFSCFSGSAPIASPTFTGTPAAPTAAAGTSTTQIATTAFLTQPGPIGSATANTGKFTTLQATGAITPSSTAGIVGTATNDNANAGSWGEYQSASPAGVTLTNGTAANVASLPLTAGDWDVSGNINFSTGAGDTLSAGFSGISTTSATQPASPLYSTFTGISVAPSNFYTSATMTTRISIAGSATVYLVGTGYHSGGTLTATGIIRARRVR